MTNCLPDSNKKKRMLRQPLTDQAFALIIMYGTDYFTIFLPLTM